MAAYERLLKSDVKNRLSIDTSSLTVEQGSPRARPVALAVEGRHRKALREDGQDDSLGYMKDQVFNLAEAKMHLSRIIERVERGERIVIAKNNRPVAVLSPVGFTAQEALARIDAVRDNIRRRNGGRAVLSKGETWRDLIEEGRRLS